MSKQYSYYDGDLDQLEYDKQPTVYENETDEETDEDESIKVGSDLRDSESEDEGESDAGE